MPLDEFGSPGSRDLTPEQLQALREQIGVASRQLAEDRVRRDAERKAREMGFALDIATDVIRDPSCASRLADRHNAHVRSFEIAELGMQALNDAEQGRSSFELLRAQTRDDGIFVYPYTPESELQRIVGTYQDGTPKFLIVEASGRHPCAGHNRYDQASPAADAQFSLSQPSADAESILELPSDPGTFHVEDPDLVERMRVAPHSIAMIEDIATDEGMGHLHLAASAMRRGIHEIVHAINPTRGEFPIEYIAAEIVSIQGFVLLDGRHVRLQRDLQIAPVPNGRSLIVFEHFNSGYCGSFERAFIRKNRVVPVEHPHVQGILVDWIVLASKLKQPTA